MKRSKMIRFVGANIKGTPAMSADAVASDLDTIEARADIIVAQEFRWPWYWRQARKTLSRADHWRSFPTMAGGLLRPVFGAQPVMWRGDRFRRVDSLVKPLHDRAKGISAPRYIRGALLADRSTALKVWAVTTHFVVGGDEPTDAKRRREILAHDIEALDGYLGDILTMGHPVVVQLDANIKHRTPAWRAFRKVIKDHGGTFHGEKGVEYLATFDGLTTDIEVAFLYRIPAWRLNTDHETRGLGFRLVEVTR